MPEERSDRQLGNVTDVQGLLPGILFVTGLSSAGQQITADAPANDSYLAKPYNLKKN